MGFSNIEKVKRFVERTKAYKRLLNLNNEDVKTVLADLGRFAPVDPTAKCTKPYQDIDIYIMIGRRQVIDYILGKINMTDSELSNLVKQERLNIQQQQVTM